MSLLASVELIVALLPQFPWDHPNSTDHTSEPECACALGIASCVVVLLGRAPLAMPEASEREVPSDLMLFCADIRVAFGTGPSQAAMHA